MDAKARKKLIEQYKETFDFAEYVPVSAFKRIGLDDLRNVILKYLPEGPAYFPEDYITDQPERFLAQLLPLAELSNGLAEADLRVVGARHLRKRIRLPPPRP